MKSLYIGAVATLLLAGCSRESEKGDSSVTTELSDRDQATRGKLVLTAEWKGLYSGYYAKVGYYENGDAEYE